MITKYNQYIKENFEDMYVEHGFKLLVTEDEKFIVWTNRRMKGCILVPTIKFGDVVNINHVGKLNVGMNNINYLIKKLNRKYDWNDHSNLVYTTNIDVEKYIIKNLFDNEEIWKIMEDKSKIKFSDDYFKDYELNVGDFEKVTTEYKYKVIEFQRGIVKKEKLNF
jgi:hypothetical protein